ncbi:SmpA/OmlA [Hylemonella gracilis ATCC 19624]|uniref:Outer membrane protein assembly factor BamE n=2 Tax=Hylemonella gracilis TaxID=80880 RepID=F3KSA6_9BURK|nr:SmpA/OmlA [Hylemonella gracilis ATCC 19624]
MIARSLLPSARFRVYTRLHRAYSFWPPAFFPMLNTLRHLHRAVLFAALALAAGTVTLLTACAPYRPTIVQGNVITREQLGALRPGMSRIQVRDILGTPLVSDLFHASRWDYVFTIDQQGVAPQARRLTVLFQDDRLERFETNAEFPSEVEFAASLSKPVTKRPPLLQADEKDLADFPAPAPAAPLPPVPPLPSSYPPLENAPQS